jgi:VWFA-related protein
VLVFVLALSQGAARPGASSPEPQGQAGDQPRSQPPSPPPAPQQTDNPQPTFRGGVSFVRVDVAVTDRKAQPITDLKQTDFEVFEDGKPQTIETFRLVKVDGTPKPGDPPPRQIRNRADEELEAGRDDVRVFAFLLDDYHVRLANSMSVREPLTRFVRNELRANDLVTVMYPLTPVADLEFTRDHDRVVTALERFEGRKFDYRPRNQFEWNYERYPTEVVERIRNDVVMGALKALAVRLGSLREGRKSIIFVSEGLTAMLPPQMRRADASQPGNPVEAALAAGGQDGPMQITAEWFGQADLYSRLREVYEAANRNNASIYSLDPRGLAPFEFGFDDIPGGPPPSFATDRRALQMSQDTLRSLSEETDGRAIVNRNSLAQGLAQIATDSSFYYLIGYNAQTQNDGKFHEITVRVKRRDVQVRARKGYWAMTPADVERAANPAPEVAKPVQQALASIATSVQAARYIRTWLGTERGTDGRTRVTLVWEPLPAVPGVRRDPPGRVSLLAADARGNLVFRGRSPDAALASAAGTRGPNDTGGARGLAPAAGPAAAPQRLIFEAPPGKVELRMTVEAAGTGGTLDQEVRTVDVPDLTAPEAAMSTPRVYRARTVREFQALAADATAVPVAGREFSRTERLLIRFDAYGAGTDRPSASAALLNRAGQKMADVPVAPAAAGGTHQIDLGLSSIPGGEYVVEITVKGASGEAKELVPFRVGS